LGFPVVLAELDVCDGAREALRPLFIARPQAWWWPGASSRPLPAHPDLSRPGMVSYDDKREIWDPVIRAITESIR